MALTMVTSHDHGAARSVAVVVRKSTRDEAKVSLSRQEQMGRQWAALTHPRVPVTVYLDDGISGADMNRPGWQQFAADVRAGRIGVVWTYEQSRLTRAGVATWDEVALMLTLAGIPEVITHRQGVISVAEGNRLQGRLLAVIDQEERERAKVRTLDAHEQLAREGRPSGGRAYGYRYATDDAGRSTLAIDPEEAAIVQEAADRVLRGESLTGIAKDFEDRGIPTARGGKWTSTHIRNMVTKPTVAGLRSHHGTITEAAWPAILDRQTWERLRALLSTPTTVTGADGRTRSVPRTRRRSRSYLLTGGIAVCGLCGAPLVAQRRAGREGKPDRSPIYSCHPNTGGCARTAIVAEPFEAYVTDMVLTRLRSPKMARALRPQRGDRRGELAAELAEAERRLADLAADYAAGDLSKAEWLAAREAGRDRVDTIRREIDRLPDPVVVDFTDPAALADRWESLTLQQKQAVLRRILEAVVLHPAKPGTRKFDPDRVEPRWLL